MTTCRCDPPLPPFTTILQIQINTDGNKCDQTDKNTEMGLKFHQKVLQAAVK